MIHGAGILLILVILTIVLAAIPSACASGARTWYVAPSGGDFSDIHSAIDAASAGDTIFIRAGTYSTLSDIVLQDKANLHIQGESTASVTVAVTGNSRSFQVSSTAPGTCIEGITFSSTILHVSSSSNVIANNVFADPVDDMGGLWLGSTATFNTVRDNVITGATGAYSGMSLDGSSHLVENNTIKDGSAAGLTIYGANNTVTKNSFVNNTYAGIEVFSDGYNPENNEIYLNTIAGNGVPVTTTDTAPPSVISWASPEAVNYTYDGTSHSGILGNYWGDAYTGNDSDGNGVGDTTFTIPDSLGIDSAPLVEPGSSYLIIANEPVADFNATPTSGAAPLTVQFTDQSANDPASWAWDFNNDGVVDSTVRNPSYYYTMPGNYTVNLTVSNSGGSNSMVKTDYIVVSMLSAPIADFTADPTSGTVPLAVNFTDISTGKIDSWAWDFDNDGVVDSTLQDPTFTYHSPGNYTVNLTAYNSAGGNSTVKAGCIVVSEPDGPPIANCTANVTYGISPLTVQFTDLSSNKPTSWAWDFDNDGVVDSTLQNPVYTYTVPGNYTVGLNATNMKGSGNMVKSGYVVVTPKPCDLTVQSIYNTGIYAGQFVFALVPNNLTCYIKNNGPGQSPVSMVYIVASDGWSDNFTIPSTASGSYAHVYFTDPTIRSAAGGTVTYTATIDPDNQTFETTKANNVYSRSLSLTYNGYMGKRYENGSDVDTMRTYDLRGDIINSFGNSQYVSGSFGDNGWLNYTVLWTSSDLPLPAGAKVVDAWLYVPYCWDNSNSAPDHVSIDFNGIRVPYTHWYNDQSNFGGYAGYVYGLMTYNVTALYQPNANNTALFTRESPNLKISPAGFTLAVVYEDLNASRKQIFVNEEFDALGADPSDYSTNETQATAYVPFTGMAIDMANVSRANLTTFVPWGAAAGDYPGEGNLYFNGLQLGHDVWTYGPRAVGASDSPQVAVNTTDVTAYLNTSGNIAAVQSTADPGIYSPLMVAAQDFLVVEYKDQPPIASFTANTTSGNVPLTVQFTDNSTNATSWAWDFDNDGVVDSTQQNPCYTFNTSGNYTVNLTVTGPGGNNSMVKNNYITVNETPLTDATVTGNTIPATMNAGEPYPVSVTVMNTGSLPWNESSMFRLGMVGDESGDAYKFNGTTARAWLPDGANVLPGESVTFNFTMTAPAAQGVYQPSYRMVWEGHEWFGGSLSTTVNVTAPLAWASITGSSLPGSVVAGVPSMVSVTVKNTGVLPWNESSMFRLGMVGDESGDAYKFNGTTARVWLPAGVEVAPGDSYTFNFTLNAKVAPGTYHPEFRMVWEGHEWFGDVLNTTVGVSGPDALVTGNTIPASMSAGQKYDASITVQNTGSLPWNETSLFRLGMVDDEGGDAYKFNGVTARVWLPAGASVLPGDSVTFNFTMTAPSTAGTYQPSYRMVWEGHEWFGQQLAMTTAVN